MTCVLLQYEYSRHATSSYLTPHRVASDPRNGLPLTPDELSGLAAALWKLDAVISPHGQSTTQA
jgi:hypothetical protein